MLFVRPFIYNLADKCLHHTFNIFSAFPKTNKLSCWRNAKNQKVKTDEIIEYKCSEPNDKLHLRYSNKTRTPLYIRKVFITIYSYSIYFVLRTCPTFSCLVLKCGYDLKMVLYKAVFYSKIIFLGSLFLVLCIIISIFGTN